MCLATPFLHKLKQGIDLLQSKGDPSAMSNLATIRRVQIIDSHTGGEPTRVIVSGGPDLGRGSDVIVGALLCEPACVAGDLPQHRQ